MLEKGWGGGTHKSEIRVRKILVCWEMTASQDGGIFSIKTLPQQSPLPFFWEDGLLRSTLWGLGSRYKVNETVKGINNFMSLYVRVYTP